jgi:hypothetical protein
LPYGRTATIALGSLTRATNALLSIQPGNAGQLGLNERVTVAGGNASFPVTNGMVAPWMWNATDNQFLTYGEFGFTNAGFSLVNTGTAATGNIGTGVERIFANSATALTLTGFTLNAYALRADQSITGGTINIASGGLIAAGNNPTISGSVNFGTEALIHVANNQIYTQAGLWTAGSVAKDGLGTLRLNAENPGFTGNIALNQGGLNLAATGTVSSTTAGGSGGVVMMNGYGATLTLSGGTANATFANSVSVAPGNALVNINNSNVNYGLGTAGVGGNLTFGGSPGDQGQTVNFTSGSSIAAGLAGRQPDDWTADTCTHMNMTVSSTSPSS